VADRLMWNCSAILVSCHAGTSKVREHRVSRSPVASRGENMSSTIKSKWTSITVQRTDVDALDSYAQDTFGTDEVSYRAIIQNLLTEADDDE